MASSWFIYCNIFYFYFSFSFSFYLYFSDITVIHQNPTTPTPRKPLPSLVQLLPRLRTVLSYTRAIIGSTANTNLHQKVLRRNSNSRHTNHHNFHRPPFNPNPSPCHPSNSNHLLHVNPCSTLCPRSMLCLPRVLRRRNPYQRNHLASPVETKTPAPVHGPLSQIPSDSPWITCWKAWLEPNSHRQLNSPNPCLIPRTTPISLAAMITTQIKAVFRLLHFLQSQHQRRSAFRVVQRLPGLLHRKHMLHARVWIRHKVCSSLQCTTTTTIIAEIRRAHPDRAIGVV
jgi:hypothetical protein